MSSPPHRNARPDTEVKVRRGDREIRADDYGPAGGSPVLFHHGSPGCRLLGEDVTRAGAERGLRLISYDRPGYAGSSPHRGRHVADAAGDTAAVADALGIERFGVWGISGGGPHALACAALLPDRVTAAAVVCGIAPFDGEGLDFYDGMGKANRTEWDKARNDRENLEPFVHEACAEVTSSTEGVLEAWGTLLSEGDREILLGGYGTTMLDRIRVAVAPGIDGWLEDDIAFVEPWGFDPAAIAVPVAVFHGQNDPMVPHGHGAWLASVIPDAMFNSYPDEGHLTLGFDPARPLDWLAEARAAG
jgi:pimeloyl-ACP methyl ester carboxylesterase